ncbi:MAG: hypothetical protein ACM3JB_06685 [Acidobacteriaceae bacterium]
MKRLSWLGVFFGLLIFGSLAASAQVTVVIGPRPVFVPRPPVVAVRPVFVPAQVVYRPAFAPVVVPRPYYPLARPVVVYRRPVYFYRPGPVRRAYWRHERREYRHGRW